MGADPRSMETLGVDPRTDDDSYGQFGVSCTETLGAAPRTYGDYCEHFEVSCTEPHWRRPKNR